MYAFTKLYRLTQRLSSALIAVVPVLFGANGKRSIVFCVLCLITDIKASGQSNQGSMNAAGSAGLELNGYTYSYTLGGLFMPLGVGTNATLMPDVIQPNIAPNPLPVTLIDFKGTREQNLVTLNWKTSHEHQSKYFSVERSVDARTWQTLGKVNTKGESNTTAHYLFLDWNPSMNSTYYRLKAVDQDDSFAYSRIITLKSVIGDKEHLLELSPNPVQRYLTLVKDPKVQIETVKIFDASGRKVYESSVDGGSLDLEYLPSGIYHLMAFPRAAAPLVRKFIKQ